uniref:DDE_Tnp_IS1595 domain-containing protein n=1 Tax=Meloidogyne hapla TaxID=6305 RepID=A0A1I8BQX5_MELHA
MNLEDKQDLSLLNILCKSNGQVNYVIGVVNYLLNDENQKNKLTEILKKWNEIFKKSDEILEKLDEENEKEIIKEIKQGQVLLKQFNLYENINIKDAIYLFGKAVKENELVLVLVHCWAIGYKLLDAMHEAEIKGSKTAVDWASFCREVLLADFIDNFEPLGGEGRTVEIDESKFGKRKYWRGHRVEGVWVFGALERETGRIFMQPVNHSINFVDESTGAHTNAIESSWRHAKESFSSHGRKKEHVPGNLARYMFQKSCRAGNTDPTESFLRIAGRVYNPAMNKAHDYRDADGELDSDDIEFFDEN